MGIRFASDAYLWFPTRDDGSVGFQFKADALD
jgi:hypothetical protein